MTRRADWWRRPSRVTVLVAVAAVVVVGAAGIAIASVTNRAPGVVVSVARAGTIQAGATGVGTLGAVQQASATADYPGLLNQLAVTSVPAVQGAIVKKGDVLVELDPTVLDAYKHQLATKLAGDKVQLAVATGDVQRANLQEEVALDKQTVAQVMPLTPRILSPIDGQVSRVRVAVGDPVRSGQTVATIVALHQLYAYLSISINEAGVAVPGMIAKLTFPQLPGVTCDGQVLTISPGTTNLGLTQPLVVQLSNPGGQLRTGLQVYASLARSVRSAVTVPLIGVHNIESRPFSFVVDSHGVVRQRAVIVSAYSNTRVAISSGLHAGDRVVLTNAQTLENGDRVDVTGTEG